MTVFNAGPSAANGSTVTDTVPSALTGVTWTCTAVAGSSCAAGSGTGSINTTVNLANGGSATFKLTGTVSSNASGTLTNQASVAPPSTTGDPNLANNTATDSDQIAPALPSMAGLDNFNRANPATLPASLNTNAPAGVAWSQANGNLRVDNNVARAFSAGMAIWNGTANNFGSKQGAAFTFANNPVNNSCLVLKATLGAAADPMRGLYVCYQTQNGGSVVVSTTLNGSSNRTTRGTLNNSNSSFVSGNTMSVVAAPDGTVYVYKTAGSTTTLVGVVSIPTSGGQGSWSPGAGGGRIGVLLPLNARIDNFQGGTLP
jgi:hypothetical protein